MTLSDVDRVLKESEALRTEIDAAERQAADHARRAERSRPLAGELMAGEKTAMRRLSLRRSKWPGVVEFDACVEELERRQVALHQELVQLHERLQAAPALDRQRLADWQLAGGKGERPEPTADALERVIAARQADLDGLAAAVDAVLAEKAAFVEKHRLTRREPRHALRRAATRGSKPPDERLNAEARRTRKI
jgi:hypothetical protein